MTTSTPAPTPAHVRELAAQAEQLADAIEALRRQLSRGEDTLRRTGYRLDDAAGWVRQAAQDLQATASDMARLAALPTDACAVPWGVCPEHGNTLIASGNMTTCKSAGCRRTWGYNRDTAPCAEPATHRLIVAEGHETLVCDGHALDARARLIARIEPM
ncbi:hypothetical protein [Nonomuraea dietziae]|uniref:hypothetical protein n=1 Tax=Nonomuraea dietziae TaxID=65515 RepID=UPI00341D538C